MDLGPWISGAYAYSSLHWDLFERESLSVKSCF